MESRGHLVWTYGLNADGQYGPGRKSSERHDALLLTDSHHGTYHNRSETAGNLSTHIAQHKSRLSKHFCGMGQTIADHRGIQRPNVGLKIRLFQKLRSDTRLQHPFPFVHHFGSCAHGEAAGIGRDISGLPIGHDTQQAQQR